MSSLTRRFSQGVWPQRPVVLGLIGLTALGWVLAFLVRQHCRLNGWEGADQFQAMCYSDFAHLFGERGLADRLFPFYTGLPIEQAMEYPALLAVITGLTAWMIPGTGMDAGRQLAYFDLNTLLSFSCWLAIVLIVASLMPKRPQVAAMVAIAPGIILNASLNWDLWAVLFMLIGLWFFAKAKPVWAGVFLGLGAAAKLFPLFALGAVLVLAWRSGKWGVFIKTTVALVLTWLAVNIPFALTAFDEWSRFYTFSGDRPVSFSSIWLAVSWAGGSGEFYGLLANGSFALLCLGIAWLGLTAKRRPRMAQLVFLIVLAFVLTNKVYSPQFVMWLIPLYVLARPHWKSFWWWMAAEVFHWMPVWLNLAIINGADYGAFGNGAVFAWYGAGIAAHSIALVALGVQVVRDIRDPRRDVVRTGVEDDPHGGAFDGAPDASLWPVTRAQRVRG
ncbi:MAG: hypothetical protein LBE25_04145 [Arthrobacter sp.]|nr:hypothetical protein [Arthrobacter sp.]